MGNNTFLASLLLVIALAENQSIHTADAEAKKSAMRRQKKLSPFRLAQLEQVGQKLREDSRIREGVFFSVKSTFATYSPDYYNKAVLINSSNKQDPALRKLFKKRELRTLIANTVRLQREDFFQVLVYAPFSGQFHCSFNNCFFNHYKYDPEKLSLENYLNLSSIGSASSAVKCFELMNLNSKALDCYRLIGCDVLYLINRVHKMFYVVIEKVHQETQRKACEMLRLPELTPEQLSGVLVARDSWGPKQRWKDAINKLFLPLYEIADPYYKQKLARAWLREQNKVHKMSTMDPRLARIIAEMAGQGDGAFLKNAIEHSKLP